MPVKQKKDLYIAKSVHDLNLKTQVETDKSTKLRIYCKSADKMFKEAVKAENLQDEERAYVLYMKFTSLVQYISKARDYKAEKAFFDSLAGVSNVMTAISKAEVLQESLVKRYEDLREEAEVKAKLELEEKKQEETGVKPAEAELNGEAAGKEASPPGYGQDGGISCGQLYKLFKDDTKNLLVMDTRPGADYQASRIQWPQVVSIPQETVAPGSTVTTIMKGLPRESRSQWEKRGSADCIVLLDWASTAKDLTKGSTLASLKDAVYKWDSTVTLKAEPLVLTGGYEGWLLHYPMFTTDPHVARPPLGQRASSASLTLLDFDYPSLEDDRPKPTPSPPVPEMEPSLPAGDAPEAARGPASVSPSPREAGPAAKKAVPAVNRASKPSKEAPPSTTTSSSASELGHLARPGNSTTGQLAGGPTAGPAVPSIESSSSSSSSSSSPSTADVSNSEASHAPSSERFSQAKPEIPNRSLKPATPDGRASQQRLDKRGHGGSPTDAPGTSGKGATEGGNETGQASDGAVVAAATTATATATTSARKEEELGEIARSYQLQEQQAQQELVRMRQDKMRTENKQLRQEKAMIEKELEEKVAALKQMQEELDEQRHQLERKEEAAGEGALKRTEMKRTQEPDGDPEVEPSLPPPPPTTTTTTTTTTEQEANLPARAESGKSTLVAEPKPAAPTTAGLKPGAKSDPRPPSAKAKAGERPSAARNAASAAGPAEKPAESTIPRPTPAETKQPPLSTSGAKAQQQQQQQRPQPSSAPAGGGPRSSPQTQRPSPPPPSASASASATAATAARTVPMLPAGWERRLHPSGEAYYYVDHNTARVQWEPPAVGPAGAATSSPAASASSSSSSSTSSTSSSLTSLPRRELPTPKGSAGPREPSKQVTQSPSVTKMQLKSDSSSSTPSSSGLKRSYSSPNIAQMVINDGPPTPAMPQVNRDNKPVQRMTSSSMMEPAQSNKSQAVSRSRNLNPVYGNPGRSLSGLRNLGNTCFMNSVVQCLSSTTQLTHYFITDKYIVDINRQNPLGRGGNVAQEFAIVIKALWSGQYRSISPLDLRDTVTKYVPEFRKNIGHHHDSQEFLLFLLDGLHEDLNQVKKREYIKEEDLDRYPDHVAADISWSSHVRLNQSIIVTLFQGQFKSTIRCLTCGHSSVKFEAFMYLSLPIPSSSRCTLQQCLQKFSSEEKLTGDNAIFCSRCKTNRDSAKIILIWKLPRILLIHLKRFYYEGMWRQKLQTMVDFPLVSMDMSPYTRGPKPGKPYNLYAVSNHIGTLDGGHYTASCLNVNNSRWHKFDDHEVHEASQSNIRSSAAYILFYTSLDQFIP